MTTDQNPRPTSEIDAELVHTIKKFHRLRWYGVIALAVVSMTALAVGGVLLDHQHNQLVASCSLYRDLGTLSVKPIPPVRRPSPAIITIVVDARKAYTGQCSGQIPPPSPSLVYWAHFYHMNTSVTGTCHCRRQGT